MDRSLSKSKKHLQLKTPYLETNAAMVSLQIKDFVVERNT